MTLSPPIAILKCTEKELKYRFAIITPCYLVALTQNPFLLRYPSLKSHVLNNVADRPPIEAFNRFKG